MSKLIVTDLTCQRGYNKLFSNLSFELNSGEILKISGANGSGKTSLLKILAGLNSAESGKLSINNNNVGSYDYQSDIFYLGHLPALSPELHSKENLDYLAQLNNCSSDLEISEALTSVGLKNFEYEYAVNLSAGQKRRIVLSALFMTQAKVWLLDEPFTALDADGINVIETQITNHSDDGGICVLTTHQKCNFHGIKTLTL